MPARRPLSKAADTSGLGPCACLRLRQASRAVTQMFDDALRPAGIRATQLGLLLATRAAGEPTISRLAEMLVMDRTTLSRNLKPLEKQRLVSVLPGDDRRVRTVRLTAAGLDVVERALPLWRAAQRSIVEGFGRERYDRLLGDLAETLALARVPEGPRH